MGMYIRFASFVRTNLVKIPNFVPVLCPGRYLSPEAVGVLGGRGGFCIGIGMESWR